jgi:prophage regulatory protein
MVLLNREDLKDRGINYSPVTLWRRAKAGTFPRPVKLSPSRNGWIADEIDKWITDRVAERAKPA